MAMDFRGRRRAFIVLDGIIYDQKPEDTRDCRDWVKERWGMSDDDWAASTRGYFTKDRIQFFTGYTYHSDDRVTRSLVRAAQDRHSALYHGAMCEHVYNGVVAGQEGEVWPPILRWQDGDGWVLAR